MEIYTKKQQQLVEVQELARQGGVEILAHFYQRAEVKAVAHLVGGSHEIVERARQSQAPALMICGASFMADEIQRLGLTCTLLIPRSDLSCPLAEAVTPAEVLEARKKHPQALVVVDLKVLPEIRALADLVVSPATVRQVLAETGGREIIALPGAQLVDWAGYGSQVVHRWPRAVCDVHELALEEDLLRAKEEHPQALVAVNLLCRPAVRALADFVGDSMALYNYCLENTAEEFIVVSEAGLAEFLTEYFTESQPKKKIYETEAEIFCPNMKLTTLKTMITCLKQHFQQKAGNLGTHPLKMGTTET